MSRLWRFFKIQKAQSEKPMDDEGSSLAFIVHRVLRKSSTTRALPRLVSDYLVGVFFVGRLRSLWRVPPSWSYSLLSGPYLASPADSMRRFFSRRPFSFASSLFCRSSRAATSWVIADPRAVRASHFIRSSEKPSKYAEPNTGQGGLEQNCLRSMRTIA